MKKQVLFIHGAGEGAHAADKLLADNLQKELGAAYQVHCPQMPDENAPAYPAWSEQIDNKLAALSGEVVVVGHSFGGSVVLKYLSEATVQKALAGIFLVATPYWGAEGWEVDEYVLPAELAARLSPAWPIFLYHSRTDEIVPFSHMAHYAENLPQATAREFDGLDHQFDNDLSAVAADIQLVVKYQQ